MEYRYTCHRVQTGFYTKFIGYASELSKTFIHYLKDESLRKERSEHAPLDRQNMKYNLNSIDLFFDIHIPSPTDNAPFYHNSMGIIINRKQRSGLDDHWKTL